MTVNDQSDTAEESYDNFYFNDNLAEDLLDSFITKEEILHSITKLKANKSSGLDVTISEFSNTLQIYYCYTLS